MARNTNTNAAEYAAKEYADYLRILEKEKSERFLSEKAFIDSLFDERGTVRSLRATREAREDYLW